MSETKPFVFISYARKDGREYAERLYGDLTVDDKYDAWRDERDLNPYQDFTADIENALKRSSHVVVCLTPESLESDGYVRRELNYAILLKKPIIPVRFDEILPPIQIANLTWLNAHTEKWDYILQEIQHRLILDASNVVEARPFTDPYLEYLNTLYESIIAYFESTVISEVDLHSTAQPDAVRPKSAPKLRTRIIGTALALNVTQGDLNNQEQRYFENFTEAFSAYEGQVLLLGDPGGGKTTTLLAFARDAISKRLANPSLPLPVFGRIAQWNAINAPKLDLWLTEGEDQKTAIQIRKEIADGHALILLDGLDELGSEREVEDNTTQETELFDPRPRFINALADIPIQNQILVTCRSNDYNSIGYKVSLVGAITLSPLDDDQIQSYLTEYPFLWDALQNDSALKEIARTPLLLSIFTFAYRGLGNKAAQLRNLSTSPGDLRDEIFRTYIELRWEHEVARSRKPIAYTITGIHLEIGQFAMNNVLYGEFESFSKDELKEDLIDLCKTLSLLTSTDSGKVRFTHLLLRDYFAFKWAFFVSTSKNVQTRRNAIRTLGELHDPRATSILLAALKDEEWSIRRSAAQALGKLNDEKVIEPLISVIKTEHGPVRQSGVNSLIELSAVKGLVELIHTGDRDTREKAAEGLLKLNAIDAIIQLSNSNTPRMRTLAAELLGRLEQEDSINVLLKLLNDGNPEVRKEATVSLKKLKDSRTVEPLIETLREGGNQQKRAAASVLAKLEDNRAVEPLLDALQDQSELVRIHAAKTLGKLKDPRAIEHLIVAMKDESKNVRTHVVKALINLQAVDALVFTLQDEDGDIRCMALEALGELKEERTIEAIKPLLKDKYRPDPAIKRYVSHFAAKALKQIGTREALALVKAWEKGRL